MHLVSNFWVIHVYIYYCVNSITFEVAVLASKLIMLSLPYHKIAFIFNFICQMQFLCRKIILFSSIHLQELFWNWNMNALELNFKWRFSLSHAIYYDNKVLCALVSRRNHNSESRLFSVENRSLSAGTVVWLRWIINKKQIILTCKWRTDYITLLL